MIASAEIGPDGEVCFNRELADQRFIEPNSGLYWQISGKARDLPVALACGTAARVQHTACSRPRDPFLRQRQNSPTNSRCASPSATRDRCPARMVRWRFQVAQSRARLNEQIQRAAHDAGVLELRRARRA
jgi:hypothetical protein